MNRNSWRWLWTTVGAAFFASNLVGVALAQNSRNATIQTSGGLQVARFDTSKGQIVVKLPDDIRAGDTISGTVSEEPKGNTPEEKAKNKAALDALVIDLSGTRVPASQPSFSWVPPPSIGGKVPVRYQLRVLEILKDPSKPYVHGECMVTNWVLPRLSSSGNDPVQEQIKIKPENFVFPTIGQSGRPIEIIGPFDGNSANTSLKVGGQNLPLLAESPRKVIVQSPQDQTGTTEITVKEGAKETKGTYRNVGVNLSAPKTSLLKGERTTLTVEVTGLEGLKQPVPLTLTSEGVITMEGGMYQPLVIQPSEVSGDGRYTTTRGITGIQAGGWAATATVVTHPFDFCLQDESNGNSLIFDAKTGDYIFSAPPTPATKSIVLPWIAQSRGALAPTSDANKSIPWVTTNRCGFVLDHNSPDWRIRANFDTCERKGDASIETNSPKAKFTITDRNTADNTCACGPGCK